MKSKGGGCEGLGVVWKGLVWRGLVGLGLVWRGLMWRGLVGLWLVWRELVGRGLMSRGLVGLGLVMVVRCGVVGESQLPLEWRNLARKAEYKPIDMVAVTRTEGERARHMRVTVRLSRSRVELYKNDVLVYEKHGEAVGVLNPQAANHSGVHVVALHESDGRVIMAVRFLTYQPAEHARLRECLDAVQKGRILVVLGMPEWVMFLGREAERVLGALGSRWVARVAQGEVWAWIGVVGGRTLAEGATTRDLRQYPSADIWLDVYIAKRVSEPRCTWYTLPELHRQATFCERYEGYGDLCHCTRPFLPDIRKLQKRIPMQEDIPVVIVTANKPRHLYRLMKNIFTIAGGGQTEVILSADGGRGETLDLARVLGVAAVAHRPQGVGGNRTNANVRFALHTVFARFPQADKAILLEDDLLISPDFFSFFHQAAPLLTRDPTISCINAFSSYSFPATARDPGVLLRARSYPMYGWMTTRAYAAEVIPKWVSERGDWDWWLTWEDLRRGRDVVLPEVSRTFHSGSAGVHVSGFEQAIYFNRMIYNHQPDVTLVAVDEMVRESYEVRLASDLRRAETLTPPSRDLFNMTWLTRNSLRPLAIYLYAEDDNDKYQSFSIFLKCLRTYDLSTRELYKGVMRLRWHRSLLYLVGCPASPFCVHNPHGQLVYKPTPSEVLRVTRDRDQWDLTYLDQNHRLAHQPHHHHDLSLSNIVYSHQPS